MITRQKQNNRVLRANNRVYNVNVNWAANSSDYAGKQGNTGKT